MGLALSSRRFRGAVGVVALATGVFAAWIGLRVGGGQVTLWVDDLVTPLAALIACVLCFRARARARPCRDVHGSAELSAPIRSALRW
jgi:hypothetical protein